MTPLDPRIAAGALAAASLLLLVLAFRGERKRPKLSIAGALLSLVLFAGAVLCGALAISVQGYRALTREELAAVVEIEPLLKQRFVAHVTLTDGRKLDFQIAGDELYVDARVLKWHPWVNLLGLHTSYALDRISGRYTDIEDERHSPRTIFSLVQGARLDAFVLRRQHELLAPLVDASYGSATFASADRPTTLEVRVSTTGLLLRERAPRVAERAAPR